MQSLLSLLGAQKTAKEETASIDSLAAEEIRKEILDACLLPSHDEIMQFMQFLSYKQIRPIGKAAWIKFCDDNELYLFQL